VNSATDTTRAMKAAVRALARRPMSRRELREKLAVKFDAALVDRVLADLERQKLLSDHAAADAIAHAQHRRGSASGLIEERLRERGIEPAAARRAVKSATEAQGDTARAFELARQRVRTAPAGLELDAIRRRVFAWLARRGYAEETCRDAVERAVEGIARQ